MTHIIVRRIDRAATVIIRGSRRTHLWLRRLMKMMQAFWKKMSQVKNNLTLMDDDHPLGRPTLIIVLFLDFFILFSVFYGLSEHTRQLTSPREHVPQVCRDIVIDRDWEGEKRRTESLGRFIDANDYRFKRMAKPDKDHHPTCEGFMGLLEQARKDTSLKALYEKRRGMNRKLSDARDALESIKGAYDTALIERLAVPGQTGPDISQLEIEIHRKTSTMNAMQEGVRGVRQEMLANDNFAAIGEALDSITPGVREELRKDLRSMNRWFPFKELLMQGVFLLPLFAVFYFWYAWSIRRGRSLQSLVASHLLVVVSIPIVLKVIEALYEIIPKNLLRKLMEALSSLRLIALWHYFLIAAAVCTAFVLMYVFQKKLFHRGRMMEKRIARGQCQGCGKKLPGDSPACPFCGFEQFRKCPHCQSPTYVHSRHCRVCGRENV